MNDPGNCWHGNFDPNGVTTAPDDLQTTHGTCGVPNQGAGLVDPLTTELVRLRVARHHNCRLCKSLRTRAAMSAGGDESVYDKVDDFANSDLDDRQKTALRITEALIIRPDSMDGALVARAREQFTPAELVELVLDVMRNSANKVAVAFGADAPNVSEGLQAYDIGADGDMVMGEPLAGRTA